MKIMRKEFSIRSVIDKVAYLLGDDLSYFSASLSFYTIFSIIPLLWVTFYILSSFEEFAVYYSAIKTFIIDNLIPAHTETVDLYLNSFLKNSRQMGFWGLVYILLASVLFYRNYQYVVNKIFQVQKQSFWHALETYLVLAIIMPVVLGSSFYLSDYIQRVAGDAGQIVGLYTILSYLLIWFLFYALFIISPSMRINQRVALLVSFIISIIWQSAKTAYVYYVIANHTYVSLYGSFSVLLFFLLWIYLSWFMLLHGLRMCYILQCRIDGQKKI